MKLIKIIFLILFLTVLLDLVLSRKKKKNKHLTDSETKTDKKKKKNKDVCEGKCSELCKQEKEDGVVCEHGMCFPNGLPICYCWYVNPSGRRVNCENVKLR